MAMDKHNDKWAESFRRKLDSAEVKPSEELWARIEADLPPVERRRFPVILRRLTVAAASAAAVFALVWSVRPDKETSPAGTPAASGVGAEPALVAGAADVAKEMEEVPAEAVARPQAVTASQLLATTERVAAVSAVEKSAEVAEVQPVAVAEAPVAVADVAVAEQPADTVGAVAGTMTEKVARVREFMAVAPERESRATQTAYTSVRDEDEHTSRWHIALAADSRLGEGTSGSVNGFMPLSYKDAAHEPALTASSLFADDYDLMYIKMNAENIDSHTQTDEVVSFPINYSASVRYMINDRWGVNLGVSYARVTTERRSGSDQNFYVSKAKMHYVGVPVSVSYTFYDSRYLTLYAIAGGSVEKCVSGKQVDSLNIGQESASKENAGFEIDKPWQFALNAGAGVQFNITRRYGLFAEPQLVCDLSDDGSNQTTFKRRDDLSFQLAVGIRVNW